jgi:hypothetical protein
VPESWALAQLTPIDAIREDASYRYRPDSDPRADSGRVTLRSRGVLPVAILSTPTSPASSVDVTSPCFGPARQPSSGDCSEAHETGHVEDVNGDNVADVLLHFDIQQVGLRIGDRQACVLGRLDSGARAVGCDKVDVRH